LNLLEKIWNELESFGFKELVDIQKVYHKLSSEALKINRVGLHKLKLSHMHYTSLLLANHSLINQSCDFVSIASRNGSFVEKTLHFKTFL